MNMELTIAEARHRLDAFDLSTENARLADLDGRLAQIEAARLVANDRYQEVLTLLRGFSSIRLPGSSGSAIDDGRNVADALLAGVDPTEAAALALDCAKLEDERDALREGMKDLARRQRELSDERNAIRPAAGRRILAELQPLCDELEDRAIEAANVIEQCFAGLSAIASATRTGPRALQAMQAAVDGLRAGQGLLRSSDMVNVPPEISDLLAILVDKGPAYNGGKPTMVQVRDRHEAATIGRIMRGDRVPPRPGQQ